MNLFDKHIYAEIEAIREAAEVQISNIGKVKVRLYIEVAQMEDEGIIAQALRVIAAALWMNFEDYTCKARDRGRADLRFIGALLIRKHYPTVSISQLARLMAKGHTSTLHALKRGSELLTVDPHFKDKYTEADRRLSQYITDLKLNR